MMKLLPSFSTALLATALFCLPAIAQTTVIDFGAFDEGGNAYVPFSGTVDAGDPPLISLQQNNAQVAQVDNPVVSTNLNGGATLSWTNVSAWNNNSLGVDPGQTFFLKRATDPLATFFTVTTANPTDQVSIDFLGGLERDALITINGVGTVVAPTDTGNNIAWTNVFNGTGSVTGELTENSADEGNIGAARITITPAVVPEPSSMALLGLGACTVVLRRRRS